VFSSSKLLSLSPELLLQDLIDLQLSLIVVEFPMWERFELLYFSQGGWVDYWG
jgi:hypothetical protein